MEVFERQVDLHCHSTASDGSLAPAAVVRLAAEEGLRALALTDHDTVAGLDEAARTARQLGIEFIPGIEVSCPFPRPGTLHLLGWGFALDHPSMRQLIDQLVEARDERAEMIVARLNRLGIDLSLDEVREEAGEMGGIGRPHMAAVLVRRGHAISSNDAFRQYLGSGGAAYVDNLAVPADQVIAAIREAGGLVSLAHPFQLRRGEARQLMAMIEELAEQGMEGLETLHTSHTTEQIHRLTRMADRAGLITTGGSDYHGPHRRGIKLGQAGERVIPWSFYEVLTQRLRERQASPCAA